MTGFWEPLAHATYRTIRIAAALGAEPMLGFNRETGELHFGITHLAEEEEA